MRTAYSVIMIVGFMATKAQFQKGVVMLGVSGNYVKATNDIPEQSGDISSTIIEGGTLRLPAGIFVADKHLVGAFIQYQGSSRRSFSTHEPPFSSSDNLIKVSAGLFYRYYWPIKTGRFAFYIQGEGLYISANEEVSSSFPGELPYTTSTGTGFGGAVRPGLTVALDNRFSLEASIGSFGYSTITYVHREGTEEWDSSDSALSAGISLSSVLIGFSFYLGSKTEPAR